MTEIKNVMQRLRSSVMLTDREGRVPWGETLVVHQDPFNLMSPHQRRADDGPDATFVPVRTDGRELSPTEAATCHMSEWLYRPFVLEAPTCSRMDEALAAYKKISTRKCDFSAMHSLLVEHDWLSLIAQTEEFKSGEWTIPFPSCVFEFRVSGLHVCAITARKGDDSALRILVRRAKHEWGALDACHFLGADEPKIHSGRDTPKERELVRFVHSHVKACCVMLDSQVAETTPQRVPHRTNFAPKELADDQGPRNSYHVVSLARRSRAARLPPTTGSDAARRRRTRLHFRRGHWRHYEDHKTWIRWQLVGSPDLGFVDKEYRL